MLRRVALLQVDFAGGCGEYGAQPRLGSFMDVELFTKCGQAPLDAGDVGVEPGQRQEPHAGRCCLGWMGRVRPVDQ